MFDLARLFDDRDSFWDYSYDTTGYDVTEDDNAFYLNLDMPGVRKEGVEVRSEYKKLFIIGKRNVAEKTLNGKRKSNFKYTFSLPNVVDVDKITAALNDGVLEVIIKKGEEKRKLIAVH